MKITYEIKNFKEYLELPLICKFGLIVSYSGWIIAVAYFIGRIFFDIEFFKRRNLFLYGIGGFFLGNFITIIFDKKRSKRTKIGVLKRRV